MIDLASLLQPAQAGALVGSVLVEAVGLYAGYGALERVAANLVIERVKNA